MEKVNVGRADLLKMLERNRAKHLEQFEKAKKVYLTKAGEVLSAALKRVKAFGKVRFPHLPAPESYADQYDTVIGMLRMSKDLTVSLTAKEYQQYVKDEWTWREDFMANTVSYARGFGKKVR